MLVILEISIITTILGVGAVFSILIVLAFFVYLLGVLNKKFVKEEFKDIVNFKEERAEDTDVKMDEELVAVIMAAISSQSNMKMDKLKIKRVRQISKWND